MILTTMSTLLILVSSIEIMRSAMSSRISKSASESADLPPFCIWRCQKEVRSLRAAKRNPVLLRVKTNVVRKICPSPASIHYSWMRLHIVGGVP